MNVGDCFRSGGYIRLASTRHQGPDRFLQALQTDGVDPGAHPDPHHVTIGNYPDPTSIDSIFNVVKDETAPVHSPGKIIRKGDTIIIRGVSHDPWLMAPANPTEGAPIDLTDWDRPDRASRWIISKGKQE